MKLAWVNLRHTKDERARLFEAGLRQVGYKIAKGVPCPHERCDAFISWNRIGIADKAAARLAACNVPVLITENASWGNTFAGANWFHMARSWHNMINCFDDGGPERFDRLGVDLLPYRPDNGQAIILLQRGIGTAPVRSPLSFLRQALDDYPGARIRHHPGNKKYPVPLLDDLQGMDKAVTWGSGAAILAARAGLAVASYMPNWIGTHEATEESRLAMFRRLAWAQWRHEEIENGMAFAWLGLCEF